MEETLDIALTIIPILSFIAAIILLIILAVIDFRVYLLPNKYNLALFLSFLVFHTSTYWQIISPSQSLLGLLGGGGLLFVIRAIANKIIGDDALGLGDVKLVMAAGAGLGIPAIFLALSLGAFIGLIHGALMRFILLKKTGKAPNLGQINVPAGVGLAIGIIIVMFYEFGMWWEYT